MGVDDFKYDTVKKAIQNSLNNGSLSLEDITANRYFIVCLGMFNKHISTVSFLDKKSAVEHINHLKKDENVWKIYVEKPSVDSVVFLRKEWGWEKKHGLNEGLSVIRKFVQEVLREGVESKKKINNPSWLRSAMNEIGVSNYRVLGEGQHGIAVHDLSSDRVYKFTDSSHEIGVAKVLLDKNLTSLPRVYEVGVVDGVDYYIRDMFIHIDDELADRIDEEIQDIYEFFYERNMDARKSNTNLDHYFDNKFLSFLSQLKKDMFSIGVRDNFDISGISLNTYLDRNGNYVLVDF